MDSTKPLGGSDVESYGTATSLGIRDGRNLAVRMNSTELTAGLIIVDVTGAGILAMPTGFANFGWLAGTVVLLVLLAFNMHIAIVFWRIYMKVPDARTYMELAEGVFRDSPDREREVCMAVVGFVQYATIASLLGIAALIVAKCLGMIFYHIPQCLPVWGAIGCIAILPFSATARRMGTWQSLIWLNLLTTLGTIFITLATMMKDGVEKTRPAGSEFVAIVPPGVSTWVPASGAFCYAFSSQIFLAEILAEMKEVNEFPKAYVTYSVPLQLVSFIISGIGGYYFKGSQVSSMLLHDIAFGPAFQVAVLCLLIHMSITLIIKLTVLGGAIHRKLSPAGFDADTPLAWTIWTGIVIAILGFSYISGNVVPFFGDLVELLGSSSLPLACYVIPILLYWKMLSSMPQEEMPSSFERSVLWLEMIMSIFMIVAGIYLTAKETVFLRPRSM